ncbi:hypothetical protein TH61_13420 [Rufibacter sp. DG15C]|uniref:hypothetical protein n=1 Tax=Rufibacter sp. DG15C TaxID=1379909 RepID=UPI00078D9889|nr:hypothetical protein [Rufibacter sp. DG15C]AMM51981.1 hypothetical protein TH61_13420 [Rufibacter sp. DG15C]
MKKTLFLALLTTSFIASVSTTFGQTYQAQAARVIANQNMQMNMQMSHQMHMLHIMSMGSRSTTLKNPLSNYIVVMEDSTVRQVQGKIKFDVFNKSYLETLDLSKKMSDPARNLKIYPKNTRSITKVFTNKKQSVPGLAADSCWLFKSVEGKINGYTYLPLPQNPSAVNSGYFKFFQKGDGRLQILQQDSLLMMMHDNEKAKSILKKESPYEALLEYNRSKQNDK